jgi:hypothetical protein
MREKQPLCRRGLSERRGASWLNIAIRLLISPKRDIPLRMQYVKDVLHLTMTFAGRAGQSA